MLNQAKMVILLLLLMFFSGCGMFVRHLDSTWTDDKTVYEKNEVLPPLEIPPELSSTNLQTH